MNLHTTLNQILAELNKTLSQVSNEDADLLAEAILTTNRVFVAGVGRSGLIVRGFAMRLTHMGFNVHIVGDATTPAITSNDLLIIGSGSGSTASLRVITEKARVVSSKIALVSTLNNSPIAQMADIVLVLSAPTLNRNKDTEFTSVQPMGSLFEQSMLLTFDALIVILMAKTGINNDAMFARHANLE